jgi:hypothetical protein
VILAYRACVFPLVGSIRSATFGRRCQGIQKNAQTKFDAYCKMDPLNPAGVVAPDTLAFDGAWMWPIVIIAALFVGQLCLQAS